MNRATREALGILMMLSIVFVGSALAGEYKVDWYTVDGGGETFSTGGTYSLGGTIGQLDARTQAMTGGAFTLRGGFWVLSLCGPIPADYDGDCDVDLDDFGYFQACITGPKLGPVGAGCEICDFDHDDDVDQEDFGIFQRCLSGPNIPADPNCAD